MLLGLEALKETADRLSELKEPSGSEPDTAPGEQADDLQNLQEIASYQAKATLRALTAFLEATSSEMKRAVVDEIEAAGLDLQPEIEAALREKQFDQDTGTVTDDHQKQRLDESVVLALKYFPLLFGRRSTETFESQEWQRFGEFCRGLSGLAHPAKPDDFILLPVVSVLQPMAVWSAKKFADAFRKCGEEFLSDLPGLEQELPDPVSSFDGLVIFEKKHLREIQELMSRQQEYLSYGVPTVTKETFWALDQLISVGDRKNADPEVQFHLRNVVRTTFANAESLMLQARFFLEGTARRGEIELSMEDRNRMRHGSVEQRIAETLNLFSDHFGSGSKLRRRGRKWKAFVRARRLRDRLTHPKNSRALRVRSAEQPVVKDSARLTEHLLGLLHLDGDKLVAAQNRGFEEVDK